MNTVESPKETTSALSIMFMDYDTQLGFCMKKFMAN